MATQAPAATRTTREPKQSSHGRGFWIALAALAISFLATLYPSINAARLKPVEILRYE